MVKVDGTDAVAAGMDATVSLTSLALVPIAKRTGVQVQLVSLSINGMDYNARSSVFEQQSIEREKKGLAKAFGGGAVGVTLGGTFGHGAGTGAAAGPNSVFVVHVLPQTRIKFTLRRKITLGQ